MKIAVFVYSQSGQAYDVAKSIFCEAQEGDLEVVFKTIVPEQDYPFPWDKYTFFDTFPETRLGIPPSGIKPIDTSDIEDADIVGIVGQSWFLSPSLPLQSFFADQQIKGYLKGRKIVFVNVCRNMWLMTAKWVKNYLSEIDAMLVGHIVLQDEAPNLISAATIVRWLINGKKEGNAFLPSAGISPKDISEARKFGVIIRDFCEAQTTDFRPRRKSDKTLSISLSPQTTDSRPWRESDKTLSISLSPQTTDLQSKLLSAGAIHYKPSILHIEKIGHRMFGLWAKFIRKKGGFRAPQRRNRVYLFYAYLVFVLFFISPFVQLLFYLTYPLHKRSYEL